MHRISKKALSVLIIMVLLSVNADLALASDYPPDRSVPKEANLLSERSFDVGGTMRFCRTSAAAPHVAAVTVLSMKQNPSLTASEVAGIINSNSTDLGAYGDDYISGNGLANVLETAEDNSPGQLSFTNAGYSVSEGDDSVSIAVYRSGGTSGEVTVDYSSSDISICLTGGSNETVTVYPPRKGNATSGRDYTSARGTLTFGDGENIRNNLGMK